MKKVMLLTKSFVVLSLLFCSIGVFADIPKTINVQGKVTNDSGGPITGTTAEVHLYISENGGRYIPFDPVGGNPVKLDSEGLYNVDINLKDMNFYADKEYKFKVEVTADRTTIRSDEKLFASNPFAFYASSSTYALVLDPINGKPLENENFYPITDHTYKIKVGEADYAVSASSITTKGNQGQVWAMKTDSTQNWMDVGDLAIPVATTDKIGGIKLAGSSTGLVIDKSGDLKDVLRINPNNDAALRINSSNKLTLDYGDGLKVTTAGNIKKLVLDYGEITADNETKAVTGKAIKTELDKKQDNIDSSNKLEVAYISGLADVATTGKYSDLTEKLTQGENITINGTTISAKDTTYTGSDGITLTGTNFTNSGVRSVATGTADGTISVNTNGTTENVEVKGLKTVATTGKYSDLTEKLTQGENITINGTTISATNTTYTGNGGIDIDGNNNITIKTDSKGVKIDDNYGLMIKTDNKGVKIDDNGNLMAYVDESTIQINGVSGKLEVKELPKYNGQESSPKNKVWGYANDSMDSQGWLSLGIGTFLAQEGLTLDGQNLKISTATGTGLIFSDTTTNAVLKISTGTGLDIDENNNVIVTAATAGNIGGFKLASNDNKDSGLKMESDILKVNVGTGLAIDTETNTVNVTTAPYAQQIVNTSTVTSNNGTIQLWAKNPNTNEQGWYTITLVSSDVVVGVSTSTNYVTGWYGNGSGDYVNKVTTDIRTVSYLSGADLAEIYQSTEKLVPGDVVSIDPAKDNAIVKTKVAEDTMVAGVISTEPGVLMNQDEKGYKLALVGKVPTKVCNEGGAIKRGDLLVSASIPGYAKKAGDNPKIGTVIGKALENSDSQKGTILVLVNLQ